METYLPIINQLYSDWLAWALINQINAAILAGTVFLSTAMLYSLRIGFLKRRIRINDKLFTAEKTNMLEQVTTAQQALKVIQEELVVNTEQMQEAQKTAEIEAERAKNHEALVNLRNEQVSSLIQSLATRFDLGERPVPLMGDIKAEDLWQQHDRVTNLIATRLQSEQQAKAQLDQAYQVETIQRRELEALRDTLQTTLVTQQDQLSKLEQALEDQKSISKIQQDRAEQVLSDALAQSQAELARIPLLEQQLQATSNNQQHSAQLQEALVAKDRLIAELEKKKADSVVKVAPQQEATKTEVKPIPAANLSVPLEIEEDLPTAPKELGLSSKFKGLFARGPEKTVEVKMTTPEVEAVKIEVEQEQEPLVIEQPAPAQTQSVKEESGQGFGKLKSFFGRGKTEVVVEVPAPAAVEKEPEPVSTQADPFKASPIEVTAPVTEVNIDPELVATQVIEPYERAVEQNPVNFVKDDIAKTKAMISSFFGKKK